MSTTVERRESGERRMDIGDRRTGVDRRRGTRTGADQLVEPGLTRLVSTVRRLRSELAALRDEIPTGNLGESLMTVDDPATSQQTGFELRRALERERAAHEATRARLAAIVEQQGGPGAAGAIGQLQSTIEQERAANGRLLAEQSEAAEHRLAAQELAHRDGIERIETDANRRISEADARAAVAERALADAVAQLSERDAELVQASAEVASVRAELEAGAPRLAEELSAAEQRMAEAVNGLEETRTRLEARDADVARLEAELAGAATSAHDRIGRLEADLVDATAAVSAQTAQLEADLETVREETHVAAQRFAEEMEASEVRRADMALAHRREVERLEAETARRVEELTLESAAKQEQLDAALGQLGARQADINRLTGDLDAARGETEARAMRLREEAEARQQVETHRDELAAELEFMRTEVLGGESGKRGLFRRPKPKPLPIKRSAGVTSARAQEPELAPLDEDADALLERRLFGD